MWVNFVVSCQAHRPVGAGSRYHLLLVSSGAQRVLMSFVESWAMNALELVLAGLSLFAAYAGSYIGDRLLDRFGA
jgi:hypothetical protein